MKKIFNWTFGGFFRTIGRTIAFLLLGGLIVLIAQKNDIKITELLGIERVSAATVNTTNTYKVYYYEQDMTTIGSQGYTSAGTATQLATNKTWYPYAVNTIFNFLLYL